MGLTKPKHIALYIYIYIWDIGESISMVISDTLAYSFFDTLVGKRSAADLNFASSPSASWIPHSSRS